MQDTSFDTQFRDKRTLVNNTLRFLLTKSAVFAIGGDLKEALVYVLEYWCSGVASLSAGK
jgi:hypothetical protein